MTTQYGRNGTFGTFTPTLTVATPEAAKSAAEKKLDGKIRKGYNPTVAFTAPVSGPVTNDLLDSLAHNAATGASRHSPAQAGLTDGSVPVADVLVSATEARVRTAPDAVARSLAEDPGMVEPRAAVATDLAPALPTRPTLAETADPSDVSAMLDDDEWVTQFKHDGDRVVIGATDGQVRILNRPGVAKVRGVHASQFAGFAALRGRWVFDGEIVERTVVLFDLLIASDSKRTPATTRRSSARSPPAAHAVPAAQYAVSTSRRQRATSQRGSTGSHITRPPSGPVSRRPTAADEAPDHSPARPAPPDLLPAWLA
jgi:hypothetical protein